MVMNHQLKPVFFASTLSFCFKNSSNHRDKQGSAQFYEFKMFDKLIGSANTVFSFDKNLAWAIYRYPCLISRKYNLLYPF